jgi:hypothetical protein
MDRRRKVELFEAIRLEYTQGLGTIQGVAKKLGTHRRTALLAMESEELRSSASVASFRRSLDSCKNLPHATGSILPSGAVVGERGVVRDLLIEDRPVNQRHVKCIRSSSTSSRSLVMPYKYPGNTQQQFQADWGPPGVAVRVLQLGGHDFKLTWRTDEAQEVIFGKVIFRRGSSRTVPPNGSVIPMSSRPPTMAIKHRATLLCL